MSNEFILLFNDVIYYVSSKGTWKIKFLLLKLMMHRYVRHGRLS